MFLKDLSMTTEEVAIDTIPDVFIPDVQKFFFGKTLIKKTELFSPIHMI